MSSVLPDFYTKTKTIGCHLRPANTSPIMRGKGKWQVSDEEFKGLKFFPFPYCFGYFVLITPDLLRPLLNAVRLNPFFWIDDVYLFGSLPATVGNVTFQNFDWGVTFNSDRGLNCFKKNGYKCKYVAINEWKKDQKPNVFETLWYAQLETRG